MTPGRKHGSVAPAAMRNDDLVAMARRDYGELINRIVVYPEGLGITVWLVGGTPVSYFGPGRYTWKPPLRTRWGRALARWRGRHHRRQWL